MWGLLAKFVASKGSGWIAIVAIVAFLFSVYPVVKFYIGYKNLQVAAAECRGELRSQKELNALRSKVAENVQKDAKSVRDEVEEIKRDAQEKLDSGEAVPQGPSGCAAELAPDAILRYHGWVRDK